MILSWASECPREDQSHSELSKKTGFYIELIHPFPNVFSPVKLEGSASNYIYLLWPLIAHLLWQPQRGCSWIPCGTSRGGEGLKIEVEKGSIMAGRIPHHIYVPNSSRRVSGFLSQPSGSAILCGSSVDLWPLF